MPFLAVLDHLVTSEKIIRNPIFGTFSEIFLSRGDWQMDVETAGNGFRERPRGGRASELAEKGVRHLLECTRRLAECHFWRIWTIW